MSGRKSLPAVWRDAVRDSELGPTPKLVAHTLATYMNGRGIAWPSRALLAEGASLGSGLRSVDAAVRTLEADGFLVVERSRGRSSHHYCATLPATAHEMRRSEWATAQQTTSNRASGASNGAPRAPESVESAESGARSRGASPDGGAAPRAWMVTCFDCSEEFATTNDVAVYCPACAERRAAA